MEDFLLENAARHQHLVKAWNLKNKPPIKDDAVTSPNITVATRIRPMLEHEVSSGQVVATFPRTGASGVVDIHELRRVSFTFKVGKVFGADRPTEKVYEELVQPLLPWVWEGNVGTLFAYGQTGSGKTYSVTGLERLIAGSMLDGTLPGERRLHVSIIELAGNSAHDLLSSRQPVSVLEDSFGNTQLAGAQEAQVSENDGSSRSHAIYRIRVENPAPEALEDGLLYLIDLAGSETARDIALHASERMEETREINKSLSTLKDCIRGMANVDSAGAAGKDAKGLYIPFRHSKLTKVLKHVFDPTGTRQCRTAVLACINPSFLDTSASKNTLRYIEMLRSAQPKTQSVGFNPAVPLSWSNKDLRNFIMLKSGNPSVLPAVLAPHESGAQLLRLPADQFISRCLQSDGVTVEQAKAFHTKFWQLHVDSQRSSAKRNNGSAPSGNIVNSASSTSRDSSERNKLHFTERIRPGMVVRWNPPAELPLSKNEQNLALILCPQTAVGTEVQDAFGNPVCSDNPSTQRYLCALVVPGTLGDSYEVHIWRQVAVDVEKMEAEVLLEYNVTTRYYHITV
ncbi:hypothetical protein N7492_003310 [Penicillium capsulatum]|uniref:Kinesin motor domain-containing protein n=1 Tax=Penicillium capsulatum TaxID=69766 RepID=A0A9W9LWG3_9EURO|nr:hypothetical protein N7492_003310 [Penicillium capsulatum]